ncbi:serine/threonine-protein kinase B-raf-like [Trichogramma pretiosum]|uniref:serine/threonine-protein kinase B-raf-like n=1 Tax=Trichogramma pretiosum TaxID=7493 RepID=UPI000C719461|nr:serine/threonine-protein kinase B-raf-like [Trichogramma pretiosum]
MTCHWAVTTSCSHFESLRQVNNKRNFRRTATVEKNFHLLLEAMSDMYLAVKNDQWRIRVGKIIDSNSFGKVHEAYWCGPVAVKALKNDDRDSDAQKRAFQNEMEILKRLRHPNILLYYGQETKPTRAIVIEMYDFSLNDYLYNSKFKFDITKRVDIGRQIARGMSYIHSHKIIHCNLKSLSIFLLNNLTVKIGNFGLALKNLSEQHSQRCGTERWMAPEIARMDQNPYTFLSDVYAFGAVLFELMAGELPHSNFINVEMIMRNVGRGHLSLDLTKLHSDTPQMLRELIHDCINFYSYKRPFFSDILEKIEARAEISLSIYEPTMYLYIVDEQSSVPTVHQAVCSRSEESCSFYSTLASSTNPLQPGTYSSTPIDGKQMNEVSKKKCNALVKKKVRFADDTAEVTKHNQSEDNCHSEMKDISERKEAIQLETADAIKKLSAQISELIKLQITVANSLKDLIKVQYDTQRKFDALSNTLTTLLLEDRQRREEPDSSRIPKNKIEPTGLETSEKFLEKNAPAAHSSQPVDVTEIKRHRCTKKGHYRSDSPLKAFDLSFCYPWKMWLGKLRNNAQIPTNTVKLDALPESGVGKKIIVKVEASNAEILSTDVSSLNQ